MLLRNRSDRQNLLFLLLLKPPPEPAAQDGEHEGGRWREEVDLALAGPPTGLGWATVQGCTKRHFPGCVNMGWKNATFSSNFTQPGKRLLVQPCILPFSSGLSFAVCDHFSRKNAKYHRVTRHSLVKKKLNPSTSAWLHNGTTLPPSGWLKFINSIPTYPMQFPNSYLSLWKVS